MNLNAGCKNNRIDINDEVEAQMNDEEEDEGDEDDDEPDFMDNSGKCWEFASKIEDEKHLKEWCQNKMGGMIVGKEEKLTRQFHCPNKECQFKAIFLKSCSIIYTRNKHNHVMKKAGTIRRKNEENTNPTTSLIREQNYVDHYGKLWNFYANIGTQISSNIFLTKFGLANIHQSKPSINLYLHCTKRDSTGGRCPFAGIYLKSNGCLYTRGQHEHTKKGKTPQNVGDDFVDHFGKIWKFYKQIGKNIKREIFHKKFRFGHVATCKSGFNLQCQKKGPNGRCKFAGIYLNSNGCFYTRGKHEHAIVQKYPNVGDAFVDRFGRTWPFHSEIGKQHIPDEIWRNKFGFSGIFHRQQTIYLYCRKMTNGKKCRFAGIYFKVNGCLYIRGKHEHK